ncbi:hypothetical protein V494_05104 [Pseudogymnoascus sp. VKM F-4513 (FW-928)]|nr:hypothetical protein V494_05104 [Pseudogymnoascus sp. VKM F-4513 (FW-928)]
MAKKTAMAKKAPNDLSGAEMALMKKRQKRVQDALHLIGTAPLSRIVQMEEEELKTLKLNLGEYRPTREPGNTLRKEIMKLQGHKFHAYCAYAEVWDDVVAEKDLVDAAKHLLENHKGSTVKELQNAFAMLQRYLEASNEIVGYACDLLRRVNDEEAHVLRQLVDVQGGYTITRQDEMFSAICGAFLTIGIKKVTETLSKPFKCAARRAKKLCRKIKKAKKAHKKKKAKKAAARILV